MPYSDAILDHYNNPRNVGSFSQHDPDMSARALLARPSAATS